jgi:hypothetical protein
MKKLGFLETFLTIVIIFGVTTVLFLYTKGYRLNKENTNTLDLKKTGMISAKSIPEGASVSLDGKLVTATNSTVSGVIPGQHDLKISKKGFVDWEKNISVYEDLVTDITAVLVSQSPRIEPLTNTGAKFASISPSLSKLAFFSDDQEKPGIWLIPLSNGAINNFFKGTPTVELEDTKFVKYSQGTSIEWSSDERKLLIQGVGKIYYVLDLATNTAETTSSPDLIRKEWQDLLVKKHTDLIQNLELPENISQMALSPKAMWAPDEKKFLYTVQNGNQLEYKVYDMEKPIPVGENADTVVFTTTVTDTQPKVTWYADSFHLIMVEGNVQTDKRGKISIVRIDGTNKTEIYNNTLMSDTVFSAPGGDKVIILTSFKSGDQTDLYTIGIR